MIQPTASPSADAAAGNSAALDQWRGLALVLVLISHGLFFTSRVPGERVPGLGRVATDWQPPVSADRLSAGAAGLLGLAFGRRSAAIKAAATALARRVAAVGAGFIGRRNLLRTALAGRTVAN